MKEVVEQFNKAATRLQETEFRRPRTPNEWQRMSASEKDYAKLFAAVVPMLEAFAAARDPGDRCGVAANLNADAIGILRTFAHGMAVLAIRRKSPELIVQGLTALAILGEVDDARDLTFYVATLHCSAMRLEIDTQTVFRDAASLTASTSLGTMMREFPLRKPKDGDLPAFGLRAIVTDEGFEFVPMAAR